MAKTSITLKGVRVSRKKPADQLKSRFFKLVRGQGYPVSQLADEWAVSEETVRKHARRFECLVYVEKSPGEWETCCVHPDTAEEMGGD